MTTHLNWGTPGTQPGLNGAACTQLFYRGRDRVAGPKDIALVNCEECRGIYNRATDPPRPWTFEERVRMLAHTGEGTYGEIDWLLIGFTTLGIGIPIVWALKPLAKAYVARLDRKGRSSGEAP